MKWREWVGLILLFSLLSFILGAVVEKEFRLEEVDYVLNLTIPKGKKEIRRMILYYYAQEGMVKYLERLENEKEQPVSQRTGQKADVRAHR